MNLIPDGGRLPHVTREVTAGRGYSVSWNVPWALPRTTNPRSKLMQQLLELLSVRRLVRCLPTAADSLGRWRLISPLLVTVLIATAPRAFSQTAAFLVTIEPPGVQNQESPLELRGENYGAEGVHVEDFNRLASGLHTFPFASDADIGNYDRGLIQRPDVFGGARTTNYLTVNTALGVSGAPSSTTIRFDHPALFRFVVVGG